MDVKRFARDEFENLLKSASDQCLQNFIEKFSDGNVSRLVKYVIPALKPDLLSRDQLLDHILDKDGRFRPSIRLSPLARTEMETVISVSWGDDSMDPGEWVDILPPKHLRSKFEPFMLMSAALDDLSAEDLSRYEAGEPIVTKISLPFYKR